ncbi:hypothetical protein BDZ89DRAFT_1049731 [Hymenopellis radicata]|nr:hypothetical protein BDZ89DRAFT_1049731 [Hymenopellis radicata]
MSSISVPEGKSKASVNWPSNVVTSNRATRPAPIPPPVTVRLTVSIPHPDPHPVSSLPGIVKTHQEATQSAYALQSREDELPAGMRAGPGYIVAAPSQAPYPLNEFFRTGYWQGGTVILRIILTVIPTPRRGVLFFSVPQPHSSMTYIGPTTVEPTARVSVDLKDTAKFTFSLLGLFSPFLLLPPLNLIPSASRMMNPGNSNPGNPNPGNPAPPVNTTVPVVSTPNQSKMPVAGSHYAPKFEGSYARDYLQQILDHGAQSGLGPDDVVDYIVHYCDPAYREQIRFHWEFDIDNPNRSWSDAAAEFIAVYGYKDEPPKMSIEELHVHLQQFASEPSFGTKKDVTSYYNAYHHLADPLRKDKTITDTQHNHYFILGIPSDLKPWFESKTPAAKQTRDSPLTIKESMNILLAHFDEKRSTFEPWRVARSTSTPAVNFNSSSLTRGAADSHARTEPQAKHTPSISSNPSVDQLAELLGQMSINNARRVLNSVMGLNGGSSPYCRVCDRRGIDLDHVPGYGTCPEMLMLAREGLVVKNAATNRYTVPDGRNIPSPPRDFRVVASASPASIVLETLGQSYNLDTPAFSLNTLDYCDALSALHSQKDTNRHDPLKRPDVPAPRIIRPPPTSTPAPKPQQPSAAAPPASTATPPPPTSQPSPSSFAPPNRPAPAVNSQPPPNPINNRDGWKRSQSSKGKDVDMKDATRDKSSYTPSFHFTSDAQEEINVDELFARLSDQARVTLTMRELMGVAPKFEEKMQKFTRRRKQPIGANTAEYFMDDPTIHDVDEIPIIATSATSRYSGMNTHRDVTSPDDFRILSVFTLCTRLQLDIPSSKRAP